MKPQAPKEPEGAPKTATPEPTVVAKDLPPELQGCMIPARKIIPAKIEIPSMKLSTDVLSLGSSPDGKPLDPPDEKLLSMGWTNDGPAIGDAKGWAIMTAHTHTDKQEAPGNRLADKAKGIKPGAIIRVSDSKGQTVCYRYAEVKKIWVDKYQKDKDHTEVYSVDGPPKISITTCWDFDIKLPREKQWQSRLIYYGDLINSV